MKKKRLSRGYLDHIKSDDRYQVFLHRTSRDLVDRIMKTGLKSWGDINSTATNQPANPKDALSYYRMNHGTRDAVVVIKIPKKTYQIAKREMGTDLVMHDDIGFYSESADSLVIHPRHVYGWIDKDTNEFFRNPYHPDKYDSEGLKPSKYFAKVTRAALAENLKREKRAKNKKKAETGNMLPPPPENIEIIP